MKSLDFFINEPYIMDDMSVGGGGGGTATAQPKTETEEEKKARLANLSTGDTAAADEPPAPDKTSTGPDASLLTQPGANPNAIDPSTPNDPSSLLMTDPLNAGLNENSTDPFATAKEAAKDLLSPDKNGDTKADGIIIKADGSIEPDPDAVVKTAADAATASNKAVAEERASGEPGATDSSTTDGEVTDRAITEPTGPSDGGDASTGNGDGGDNQVNSESVTQEQAAIDDAKSTDSILLVGESATAEKQQELKAKFDNYDADANNGTGGTKDGGDSRALHFTDDSKATLLDCSDSNCTPGSLVTEGENKGDYKFGQGDNASYLKGADVNAAYDAHNKPEATGEAVPNPETAKSTDAKPVDDDIAIPQPKGAEVELTRALKLTSEDGKATVVRRGDGVENPNHDNAEARSHLLDGQLDSDKNTFSTFEKDGEKYLGFFSEGYGEGDERSGIVKLSELEGKNLGADGWGEASDAEKAMLKSAHGAREKEIANFGGVDGYNQAEKVRETVARLQAHSTEKGADGKYSLNGEGANADQIDSLNNLMGRLNNNAEPLAGIQNELNELLSADKGKLAVDLAEQRLSELEGKGFSEEEIATLKDSLEGMQETSKAYPGNESKAFEQFSRDLDAAIDTKRNEAHKLSGDEATKFNETIADLKTRENLSPQQQQMLGRLEAMAKDGGLDKMGKYLQTELGNLAANAPKPEPKPQEGTRGGEAIDFKCDSFKGFQESIGDDVLKQTFGEKYAEDSENPALKKAIEDFESIKGDDKSVDAFKELLSKGELNSDSDVFKSLIDSAKKDNAEFDAIPQKLEEAQTKITEAIESKDEAAKTEAEDAKAKLEARQTEIQALKDARKGLKGTLDNYNKLPDGNAYRKLDGDKVALLKSGETGTVEGEGDAAKFKADPKEEIKPQDEVQQPGDKPDADNGVLAKLGLPKEGGVFDFSAAWCGPCQQMKPDVQKLEREGLAIKHSMNTDKNGLAQDFKVSSFPTLIKFDSNGAEIGRVEGKQSEANLRAFVG